MCICRTKSALGMCKKNTSEPNIIYIICMMGEARASEKGRVMGLGLGGGGRCKLENKGRGFGVCAYKLRGRGLGVERGSL